MVIPIKLWKLFTKQSSASVWKRARPFLDGTLVTLHAVKVIQGYYASKHLSSFSVIGKLFRMVKASGCGQNKKKIRSTTRWQRNGQFWAVQHFKNLQRRKSIKIPMFERSRNCTEEFWFTHDRGIKSSYYGLQKKTQQQKKRLAEEDSLRSLLQL